MHERTLSEYRTQLTEEVPENAEIDGLRFEGPQLVVYTSTPEVFAEDDRLIGRLASSLQKRLTVRPTADARTTQGEAKGTIERILSDDAGIRDIEFHPETGEVIIEAEAGHRPRRRDQTRDRRRDRLDRRGRPDAADGVRDRRQRPGLPHPGAG